MDVQVLEVGLGGRLDAVNIIDADLTIITSIGLDHMDWLGDDRGLIAVEKAGWHGPAVPALWRSTIRPLHCAAGLRYWCGGIMDFGRLDTGITACRDLKRFTLFATRK